MPLDKYFKGSGSKVLSNMQDEYGEKKGKSVFYATANKRGMKPEEESSKKSKSKFTFPSNKK